MTPEQIQARQRKDAAAKFTRDMLAVFRRRLFSDVPEKEWYQLHQRQVLQAIVEPARYLNARGASLPARRYKQILAEILTTIEAHGNLAEIRRMAIYLLHAVQRHMLIQGDRYYEEAKTPRNACLGSLALSAAIQAGARVDPRTEARLLTETLAATASILPKGGRRKKAPARGIQKELF